MSHPHPDSIHVSALKALAVSPKWYRHLQTHGMAETDEMRVGTAVHALVLGGKPVAVFEGRRDDRTEAWRSFKAEHAGSVILTPDQYERAQNMAEAIHSHPKALDLLSVPAKCEYHIDWERAGRKCCSTLDVWAHQDGFIVDLKTSRTANPAWFPRMAAKLGYMAQMAWYLDAAAYAAHHLPVREVRKAPTVAFLIVVESKPPHDVVVYEVTERALEQGRAACTAWFEQLMVCEASDHWPGYSDAVVPLDVEEDEPNLIFGDEEDS